MTKVICTICARGGSKGIKNKNIKKIGGLPLIAHSVLQAKKTGIFSQIAVSSDDKEILDIARQYGATILVSRPDELASDIAAKVPAIRHCLEEAEKQTDEQFDFLIDLDATSPLRLPQDIVDVFTLVQSRDVSNVITGTPARRSPYFNLVECDDRGAPNLSKKLETSIVRRQDAPLCYDMNASIYAWRRTVLLNQNILFLPNTRLHVMPEERSVDIDSVLDFQIVEMLFAKASDITYVK